MTTIEKTRPVPITRELTKNVFRFLCERYDTLPVELKSGRRTERLCWIRWIGYLLLRRRGIIFSDIGRAFGGRDHGGVQHGLESLTDRVTSSPKHKLDLEEAVSAFESALPESIKTKFKWQEGE